MTWWYGRSPARSVPFERDARRRFGPTLRRTCRIGCVNHPTCIRCLHGHLKYELIGLEVIGDPEPVDVTIQFSEVACYETFGLPPEDFPLVYAKPGASSPHRHPGGALCLWHPHDPRTKRWTHDKGLLDLIEITRRHLFMENHYRETNEWLLDDAPHGLTGKEKSSPWRPPKQRLTSGAGRRRRP